MTYTITYTSAAARQVRKLPRHVQQRVVTAVEELGRDPRPPSRVTALRGGGGVLRLRVADYRVLYKVLDDVVESWW